MSEAGEQRTIGLKATNFGPIVEADIELRPLTVFVGPSNTGKSYLAILIYALHSLFAEYLDPSARWLSRDQDRDVGVEAADRLLRWFKNLSAQADPNSQSSIPPLPPEVADLVREAMRDHDDLGSVLRTEIARCFGVGSKFAQLVKVGAEGNARVIFGRDRATDESMVTSIEHEFAMNSGESQSYEFKTAVSPNGDLQFPTSTSPLGPALMLRRLVRLDELAARETPAETRWANNLITSLRDLAVAHSVRPLSRPAYYLPASRTGLMQAHLTIVGATISRAASAGIVDAPSVPTLSGVVGDFLQKLLGVSNKEHPATSGGDALASALERDVLGGDVAVERSEANYPTFVYRPTGLDRELPIMTSSSMVSELAPVALYLRHYVKPGDTLIIEEPESHLHPAMQAEFALHLVRLVHAGIRVIVTTHSEWILDQFANLVRLAGLSEAEREGLRGADAALSPDDVGFWLFKPNAKRGGSVVQELKVNPDEGGLLSGYDEVADEMYNMWAEIGNRIADRGAE